MLEIQDDPIIVRFLSQVCIRSTDKVSVIECTGLDEKGRRWHFYQNNYYRLTPNGDIVTMTSSLYGFALIALLFLCATLLHTINDNRDAIAKLQAELNQCYQINEVQP